MRHAPRLRVLDQLQCFAESRQDVADGVAATNSAFEPIPRGLRLDQGQFRRRQLDVDDLGGDQLRRRVCDEIECGHGGHAEERECDPLTGRGSLGGATDSAA